MAQTTIWLLPGVYSINNINPIHEGKGRFRYILPKPITSTKVTPKGNPLPIPPSITKVWGRANREARHAKSLIYWNPPTEDGPEETTTPKSKKRGFKSKNIPQKLMRKARKSKRVQEREKRCMSGTRNLDTHKEATNGTEEMCEQAIPEATYMMDMSEKFKYTRGRPRPETCP